MRFTEDFKKQVVKKMLSPGVIQIDIARKLNMSTSAMWEWKRLYGEEVKAEIIQINVAALLHEEKIDIEKLLLDAEPEEKKREIDLLNKIEKGRHPSHYAPTEKYAVISHLKKLSGEQIGIFMRSYGLHSQHIKMWEDEILSMGKQHLDQNEIIKRQEEEIKTLRKQLKESERDKRELEILIELKKKYKRLFKQEGEE